MTDLTSEKLVKTFLTAPLVSFDTEFENSPTPRYARWTGFSMACRPEGAAEPLVRYWPFKGHEAVDPKWAMDTLIRPILGDPEKRVAMHYCKVDIGIAASRNIPVRCQIEDTGIKAFLWDENLPRGLKPQAKLVLGFTDALTYTQTQKELKEYDKKAMQTVKDVLKSSWEHYKTNRAKSTEESPDDSEVMDDWPSWKRVVHRLPPKMTKDEVGEYVHGRFAARIHEYYQREKDKRFAKYGGDDAKYTLLLEEFYAQKFAVFKEESGCDLQQIHDELELPIMKIVVEMEYNGISIDLPCVQRIRKGLIEIKTSLEAQFAKWLGPDFNMRSSEQVSNLFWNTLKLKPPAWHKPSAKTGVFGVSAEVLEYFAEKKNVGVAKALLRLRGVNMLLGTFAEGIIAAEKNGRIHTSFNPIGADTGRWACVAADTLLETDLGIFCISDIPIERTTPIRILTHKGRWCPITALVYKGMGEMYEVETESGKRIRCTEQHRFYTPKGWTPLQSIEVGERVYTVTCSSEFSREADSRSGHRYLQEIGTSGFIDRSEGEVFVRNQLADVDDKQGVLQEPLRGSDESRSQRESQAGNAWERTRKASACSVASAKETASLGRSRDVAGSDGPHIWRQPVSGSAESRILQVDAAAFGHEGHERHGRFGVGVSGTVESGDSEVGSWLHGEQAGVLRQAVRSPLGFTATLLGSSADNSETGSRVEVAASENAGSCLLEQQSGRNSVGDKFEGRRTRSRSAVAARGKSLRGLLPAGIEVGSGDRRALSPAAEAEDGRQNQDHHVEENGCSVAQIQGHGSCVESVEGDSGYSEERIVSIRPLGLMQVWDISVAEDASYVAHGFVNHNSNDPNMQNIPKPAKIPQMWAPDGWEPEPADHPKNLPEGRVYSGVDKKSQHHKWRLESFRQCFVPSPGYKLISYDLSQIELRLAAHFSKDKELIEAYTRWDCAECKGTGHTTVALHKCPKCGAKAGKRDKLNPEQPPIKGFCLGQDIHAKTCVLTPLFKTYGMELGRDLAKPVNFGLLYMKHYKSLALELDVTEPEGKVIYDGYFAAYPGLRQFHRWIEQRLLNVGWFEMLSGRRRRFMEDVRAFKTGKMQEWQFRATLRTASNCIIQGSAADVMKLGMITFWRKIRANSKYNGVRIMLQVHDEILLEAPEAIADEVAAILQESLETCCELRVPILSEGSVGKVNWGDAH